MRAQILNASAGSGKTYRLAYKYVRDVIDKPNIYRNILAVTFTNKATEEMKSRIINEIHSLAIGTDNSYMQSLREELGLDNRTITLRAKEAQAKILHDYSRFTILTIDKFFQRILRAFIKELGLDLNYNIEIHNSTILTKSADTLIEQITTDEELQRWILAFIEERIEDGTRWDVREGILALGDELFKERNHHALKIAKSKSELGRIVAEALRKSCEQREAMQSRAADAMRIIATAGLSTDSFKGKATGFARYFEFIASGNIKEPSATVRQRAASPDEWFIKGNDNPAIVSELRPILGELCDSYDSYIKQWNTSSLLRENYRSFALLADLYERVQQMCDEQNTMLLSETKLILSEFIAHNDAPFIYEKVGNRFERFMIDEFQDTSVKEWENFLPLLQNAMSQSEETSVLIVGDIKQSIYRWRGGDWRILHNLARKTLGESNTQTIHLTENYRSLHRIVEFNNRIIACTVDNDNRTLNTMLTTAVEQGTLSQSTNALLQDMLRNAYSSHAQTPRKKSTHDGYVNISTYEGEPPVIERLKSILDLGYKPKDVMILVRSNNDGVKIATDLLNFKQTNSDPRYYFDVMTQEALIVGYSSITTFVTAVMRLALNADSAIYRAIYNNFRGERDFDTPFTVEELAFLNSIRLLSPEEAFERIVIEFDLQSRRDQVAYLQAIHEQILNFCSGKIADLQLFLKWWDEEGYKSSLSVEQSETTVEITTIHKAKGLEKRVVIIPTCNWALSPKSSSIVWAESDDTSLEGIGSFPVKFKNDMGRSLFSEEYYRETVYSHIDNVNLLYVALTRAVEALHIFIRTDRKKESVGTAMLRCIATNGDVATLGDMQGKVTATDSGTIYEFGSPEPPDTDKEPAATTESILLESYPTSMADLRLRLPSQRYFDEGAEIELSPRNFGILMHKAFERASSVDEIYTSIGDMQTDGTLSPAEAEQLTRMVDKALSDKATHEWFSSEWSEVRNENDIITPHDSSTRRPDRVMIRGTKAVVVDYKFGTKEVDKYRAQIREYASLLSQIGYTDIEGYLWYVKLGRMEKVDIR